MSPLHWAVDGGHVNTVKCLIEKDAEVNSKHEYGVSECDCTTDCGLLLQMCITLVAKYLTGIHRS